MSEDDRAAKAARAKALVRALHELLTQPNEPVDTAQETTTKESSRVWRARIRCYFPAFKDVDSRTR